MRLFPRTSRRSKLLGGALAAGASTVGLFGGCGHLPFESLRDDAALDGSPFDPAPLDAVASNGSDAMASLDARPDAGEANEAAADAPSGDAFDGPAEGDARLDGAAADAGGDGAVDAGCSGSVCNGVYVSGTGDDSNQGTAMSPVLTIQRGIALALQRGLHDVFVAGGHYPEKVILADGIRVLGGYLCNASACPWTRNLQDDTAILDQDFEGISVPSSVSRSTVLEGFRVVGLSGSPGGGSPTNIGAAAITIQAGSPTITRCTVTGGDIKGASRRSTAVAILGSNTSEGPLLTRNVLVGGSSSGVTTALAFEKSQGNAANAAVLGNEIRGGNGPLTFAVFAPASGSGALFQNNDVIAGTGTGTGGTSWGMSIGGAMRIDSNRINVDRARTGSCSSTTAFCGGIQSLSSTTNIVNNVVFGLSAPRSAAVALAESESPAGVVILNSNTLDGAGGSNSGAATLSAAIALRVGGCGACGNNAVVGRVRNNILFAGEGTARYGVYEDGVPGKTVHPAALEANDFWAKSARANDVAYRGWNGTGAQDFSLKQLPPSPGTLGNFGADPLLDATFHLGAGSPCVDVGTSTEAPAVDFDNDPRPRGNGFDVGADER